MTVEVLKFFILDVVILGSVLFLSFSMGLAVLNGGSFMLGTHALMFWEALTYSTLGIIGSTTGYYLLHK